MEFVEQEVVYYTVIWMCTFIAGTVRTLRDGLYRHLWHCIYIGVVGAFYGIAVIGIFSQYGPSITNFGWGYLGISILIGTLGLEQDKLMRSVLFFLLSKFGVKYDDNDTTKT